MNIKLVWPNCNDFGLDSNGGPDDVFWVECDYDEAMEMVLPHIKRRYPDTVDRIAEEMKSYYQKSTDSQKNHVWKQGCIYFLISKNLNIIKPMPYYYPYSGQWNAYNPFRSIYPQTICYLDELEYVNITVLKYIEQRTWSGRSKFWYGGSVERGVVIHYGKAKELQILPSMFAEMLSEFSGRSVKVGSTRTNKPHESLGTWLKDKIKVTKTSISSYVAPILVAEKLTERDEDEPSKIRFVDGISLKLDYDSIPRKYIGPVFSAYDPETGSESIYEGIDGKTLWILEKEGKVVYKRVQRPRKNYQPVL